MPPPSPAELPDKVQPSKVSLQPVPSMASAPPSVAAELPVKLQLLAVKVPVSTIAPPTPLKVPADLLPEKTQDVSCNDWLRPRMAPPNGLNPLPTQPVNVRPLVRMAAPDGAVEMLRIRLELLPLMESTEEPGPWIVTASLMAISPVVNVIVPVNPNANATV